MGPMDMPYVRSSHVLLLLALSLRDKGKILGFGFRGWLWLHDHKSTDNILVGLGWGVCSF